PAYSRLRLRGRAVPVCVASGGTNPMTQTDPMQIIAGLTGPGGQWELEPAEVLGVEIPVFKHRHRALHEVLAASAEFGDHPYVVTLERTLTYGEHAARVSSLAQALRTEYGIEKGDRVAIAAANELGWIQVFWATVSIGAIAVGYNAWWSERELEYGLEHASPKLIFADAKRRETLAGAGVPVLDLDADVERMATAHPDAELPSAAVAEDAPAVILYASGTSGRPKGAVHSHRNLAAVVEYHKYSDQLAALFGDPVPPSKKVNLLVSPL